MVLLPVPPNIVTFLPVLEMLSAPSPPSIVTYEALLLIESLPFRAAILTLSPVFIMVSLALVPLMDLFLAELWILTGVSRILALDKFAAPCNVILPSLTVTIISLPRVVVTAGIPPAIKSVESARKPLITSLPSPALYLIKAFVLLPISMVSRSVPPSIVTFAPLLMIESLPSPPLMLTLKPLLRIESLPKPPLIETSEDWFSTESSPLPPSIETLVPLFEIVSLPPTPSIVTFLPVLVIWSP